MNAFVSFLIEANLGLLFFAAVYWLTLRNETQFAFKRFYLLGAAAISILIPLLHVKAADVPTIIPSVGTRIAANWLPEIVVEGQLPAENSSSITGLTVAWISSSYFGILAICAIVFLVRLVNLLRFIRTSKTYDWRGCRVTESHSEKPTFSFFNFIHIGQSDRLTAEEKEKLLYHEHVHVVKLHSLDILLLGIASVVFWFNPVVILYKRWLTELHEYEADTYSLESCDREVYINLLVKLLLPGSEFQLANHFNISMTTKRLVMMNALKEKVKRWKLIPAVIAIAVFFIAVACQEQVMTDLKNAAKNSSTTGLLPEEVSKQLSDLQQKNPNHEYIVLQMNEEGEATLKKMQFENAETGTQFPKMVMIKPDAASKDPFTYIIVEKNPSLGNLARQEVNSKTIYTIVETAPVYPGGFDSLVAYLFREIKYPAQARAQRVEGKVFVEFIVGEDGTVQNPRVLKGVSADLDQEATRVVAQMPRWTPGRQDGQNVNVKYVLPITFSLGIAREKPQLEEVSQSMHSSINKEVQGGRTHIEGTITDDSGQPVKGAHVILKNSTTGVTTDPEGRFIFDTTESSGTLVISFMGYQSLEYAY